MEDSFTGIFGLVNGEYLDGADWTPPAGFESIQIW